MKPQRLYYEDAYTHQFSAYATEQVHDNKKTAVVLDQTYFYPTSGGQPFDKGTLNDIPVADVSLRETDGAVLHWVAGNVALGKVTAVIHWPRRFDHMQQHTGQHILSQAFIQIANTPTVSFHLGDDTVTIDLETDNLTASQIDAAEDLANQIIWENRPIHIRFVSLAEAQGMNLRKIPPTQTEQLRLIEIEQFDITACGGTHVAHTGEVGMIKIIKQERMRGQVRIVFCCGQRALADYRLKNGVVTDLTTHLTTGLTDLPATVTKLQEDLKQVSRTLKKQEATLLAAVATQLLASAEQIGTMTLIVHVFNEENPGYLRGLSAHLTQQPGVVALLGLAGAKSHLLFSRAQDAPGEMNQLLQTALQALGGRGGGTAVTAQGGGAAADDVQVTQAVEQAAQRLRQTIKHNI